MQHSLVCFFLNRSRGRVRRSHVRASTSTGASGMERPLRLWSWRLVRAGVRSDPRRTPDEMRRRWTCSGSSGNGQSRRCGGRRNKGRNTTCTLKHHNLAVTIIVWNYISCCSPTLYNRCGRRNTKWSDRSKTKPHLWKPAEI